MQPVLEDRPDGGGSLQAEEVWRAEDCNKSWALTGGFLFWFVCLDTIVISTLCLGDWGSQMLPFELGVLENGTFMGYIYIKCGK